MRSLRVLEECRRIELDVGPIVCGEMIIDCFRLADMYMYVAYQLRT